MINTKPNTIPRILFFLVIIVCFNSCDTNESLIFRKRTIAIDDFFDCQTTNCVITEILLVESITESKVSKSINRVIEKAACGVLNFEDDASLDTIEKALQNFNTSYQEILKEFPEEIIPYEASIYSDVSFQNSDILSIVIDSYLFTGGAHGSGNTRYLNMDLKTGKLIENKKLLNNYDEFSSFAEKAFRKTYEIPEDASINSTGFFFENETFILPTNIGITDDHLILWYNQYEIASYAEGPIELKFNKKEVSNFFSVDIL
ncbi:DUF3298 and DUF4163 domain-containing protein [uncultured Aquimarina sp.]|uniref:DUF3298 and DUF4163 domain-containing protein n=1 Tax=uncultured Aquimarina sp. TaxID=575652 RepID=UPI002636972E|nr:DUF3298 and DUF4163 domain-containing protein [uncultured Aquimarina sp.]